ncbi:MAG: hypothetical protein E6Y08_18125 [Paenibacillus sp.]|uniref:hypothetical protein n=1 Tax=Paenibacillus sp. TaxID=58172 RepID=UPI002907BA49|nr:hypothetical protein [Paenibacillus sp.]MDU4697726.1 hypothetical protein [Paenibacillus sp.]
MKRRMLLPLVLTLLLTITACSDHAPSAKSVGALKDVVVTADHQEIQTVRVSPNVGKPDYEDMSSFRTLMEMHAPALPYIHIGEPIQIEFLHQTTEPDSYELIDYVLTEEGGMRYKIPEPIKPRVEFNQGTATFTLEENFLVYASSASVDYEPGAVLRGFRLLCTWGDKTQEVAFVIRTDVNANFGSAN